MYAYLKILVDLINLNPNQDIDYILIKILTRDSSVFCSGPGTVSKWCVVGVYHVVGFVNIVA